MNKNKMVKIIFAELIRAETSKVIDRLDGSYTDGGIKAGERAKALADMALQAYQDSLHCAEQVEAWALEH